MQIEKIIELGKKCLHVTASYHPDMTKLDIFGKRTSILKKNGINIVVEFVGYPNNLLLIPELQTYFEMELGVKFCVDPYIDPKYQYSEKEKEIIKKYINLKIRKLGYDFNDHLAKRCSAGSKYFVFLPNGDVYSCFAGFYYSTGYYNNPQNESFHLGNLFDNTFKPIKKEKKCSYPCQEACDLEIARVRYASK